MTASILGSVPSSAESDAHLKGASKRVIVLRDERQANREEPSFMLRNSLQPVLANGLLADQLGRQLHDLRISVTDRCNFRCSYCMPKEVFNKDYPYLPHSSLLTFEEITRLARIFMSHGVRKIRLTGGEPLLFKKDVMIIAEEAKKLDVPMVIVSNARFLDEPLPKVNNPVL